MNCPECNTECYLDRHTPCSDHPYLETALFECCNDDCKWVSDETPSYNKSDEIVIARLNEWLTSYLRDR